MGTNYSTLSMKEKIDILSRFEQGLSLSCSNELNDDDIFNITISKRRNNVNDIDMFTTNIITIVR